MTKTFIAAAAMLAAASPAFAHERSFTRDGVTYSYTATDLGDSRVIEGQASQGGKFRLIVKNGWVKGHVADTRVSYRAPKAPNGVQVAQR